MGVSDAVITASYYAIPVALVHFVRRNRTLHFDWIFLMFSAFIFACGTTHLIAILNIWRPAYWFDAWLKLGTALISLATAVFLWPLLPRVSRFLEERKRAESDLDAANQRLTESLTLLANARARHARPSGYAAAEVREARRTRDGHRARRRRSVDQQRRCDLSERARPAGLEPRGALGRCRSDAGDVLAPAVPRAQRPVRQL